MTDATKYTQHNLMVVAAAWNRAMQNPPSLARVAQFLTSLPSPKPIVRVTTVAGAILHQFTIFTRDSTIKDVQCAIRGHQMLAYLEQCGLPAPPVPGGIYRWAAPHGRLIPAIHTQIMLFFLLGAPVRAALQKAPTSYDDTFALRLHRPADPSVTALTPGCRLGSIGLTGGSCVDLVVTTRKDRADLDAANAKPPSDPFRPYDVEAATCAVRRRDKLLYGMGPATIGPRDSQRFRLQLDDVDIARALVERDSDFFQHLSPAMRADRSVLMIALRSYGQALAVNGGVSARPSMSQGESPLWCAAENLRADREVVLAAIAHDGAALSTAAKLFRADRHIVLAAVTQNGYAYRCVSADLRADPKVALAAVSQAGYVLQFLPEELCNNREIVLAAIRQAGIRVLQFASFRLRNDDAFVATATRLNSS